MKPDTGPTACPASRAARLDLIERAHLKDAGDTSHVMYRYATGAEFDGFQRRFWIPVWSVPPGEEVPQRVLQYPVCLLVVTGEYARFYGVVSGLSTTRLAGDGWAVGLMLAPAAGFLLARGSVAAYTDRFVDVGEVLGRDGVTLVERVRGAMAPGPHSTDAHHGAMAAYAAALRPLLPADREGELVNRLVAYVEDNREVLRVAQLCDAFDLTERALQRLVHRRLGFTPKWLTQRRRLQEAAERLRHQPTTTGAVAALLGYADQAHFIRDFSRVTAMTPGQFAARHA
jgi:methylphosphotriester-DNA--protein-cysteine methyltransferase